MVQFLPSAEGTMPYKTPMAAQILGGAQGAGQAAQGTAQLIDAIKKRQMLSQYLNQPQGSMGPLGNASVNRLQNLQGSGIDVSKILGPKASTTTMYMDPTTGSLSMQQSPGSIPIGGFTGPSAVGAIQKDRGLDQRDEALEMRKANAARVAKLQGAQLTPEQKMRVSLISAQSRVLGNPMIELQPDETTAMTAHMNEELDALEKEVNKGGKADASDPAVKKPDASKKADKRVKVPVSGPNGQKGLAYKDQKLPNGWNFD